MSSIAVLRQRISTPLISGSTRPSIVIVRGCDGSGALSSPEDFRNIMGRHPDLGTGDNLGEPMERADLEKLSDEELTEKVARLGVNAEGYSREKLVAVLFRRNRPFDLHDSLRPSYDHLRVVLLFRSPRWLFCFWEFDSQTVNRMKRHGGSPHLRARHNGKSMMIEPLRESMGRYHLGIPEDGGNFQMELGGVYEGSFIPVLASNVITVEPAPKETESPEFVIPDWVDSPYDDRPDQIRLRPVDLDGEFETIAVDVNWYRPNRGGK